ncbi:MAG: hypothetical protein AAFV96_09105 [Pseudomonadota bacterium]
MIADIAVLLALMTGAGAIAGIAGGAFGAGGGIFLFPAMLTALEAAGYAPQVAAPVALGSSLTVVAGLAARSLWLRTRGGGGMASVNGVASDLSGGAPLSRVLPALALGGVAGGGAAAVWAETVPLIAFTAGAVLVAWLSVQGDQGRLKRRGKSPVLGLTPMGRQMAAFLGSGGLAAGGLGGAGLRRGVFSFWGEKAPNVSAVMPFAVLVAAASGLLGWLLLWLTLRGWGPVAGQPPLTVAGINPLSAFVAGGAMALTTPLGAQAIERVKPRLRLFGFFALLVFLGVSALRTVLIR